MNHELKKHKTRDTVLWVIVFILIAAIIASLAVALVRTDRLTTTKTLNFTAYSIGSINRSTGEYEDSTLEIYTKGYINAKDIKIVHAEGAEFEYYLFFYKTGEDGEKEFISVSENLYGDFDGSVPEEAEFVRILIVPNDSGDGLSIWDIPSFAKQLTVTYLK